MYSTPSFSRQRTSSSAALWVRGCVAGAACRAGAGFLVAAGAGIGRCPLSKPSVIRSPESQFRKEKRSDLEDVRLGGRLAIGEDGEIAALIGLGDVLRENGAIAARVAWLGSAPRRAPLRHLGFAHQQVQAPGGNVELYRVTVLDQGERSTHERLGRHV